jgi:hypothetical protein
MGPLAPLAIRPAAIAQMIAGDHAEDCSNCDCSPERRANHICCCCQKKHLREYYGAEDKSECSRKKQQVKNATHAINSCPCGGNKITEIYGTGLDNLFPFFFSSDHLVAFEAALNAHIPVCRSNWLGEPPDPPPRLTSGNAFSLS